MNRFFWVCAIFGLFVIGCGKASDSATQNGNKPAATASPSATSTPGGHPAKPADTSNASTDKSAKGDVTGAYFPVGTLSSDFSEIEHLSLATIDEQGKPAPLNGFIRPKRRSDADYNLVGPKLNGNNLTFLTMVVDGV